MNADHLHELLAGELLNELTPAERAELERLVAVDPAAASLRKEFIAMNDLLEKTNREAQPDASFEQRMVSGVRRKLNAPPESPWGSVVFLWRAVRGFFAGRRWWEYAGAATVLVIFGGVALGPITGSIKTAKANAEMRERFQQEMLAKEEDQKSAALQPSPDSAGAAGAPSGGAVAADNSVATQDAAMAGSTAAAAAPPADAPSMAVATTTPASTVAPTMPEPMSGLSDGTPVAMEQAKAPRALAYMDATDALKKDDLASAQSKTTAAPVLSTTTTTTAPVLDNRKLVRNAEADLEVKSYQDAVDRIGALAKDAGGYVDSSNSQRGGNGKLQGTLVIKVLPQNLDGVLLKLRDLGKLRNQSIATEDVTKEYTDTQARLDNARRMETQLQALLQRDNGKVADLLQVERELGRVRGDIEQMQGELKLYDFQVQFATVTLRLSETDLHEAAAYLLKEQDDFSLYVVDVEQAFQQARTKADAAGAQILSATLTRNNGSDDASGDLTVVVAPEKIESFLSDVRGLGRVANFNRQTQRVANDGGDPNAPADETRTDRDKVQVHVSIQSDNVSRQQVALTVVAPDVAAALDQARAAATAQPGADILSSSLNTSTGAQATAQLSVRVPASAYPALLASLRALGRSASFSVQHNDPGAAGTDEPVILSLTLTDHEDPVQVTELALRTEQVEAQSAQIKTDAAAAGAQVKDATFERRADGLETACVTLDIPQSGYAHLLAAIQQRGTTESLSVERQDRPGLAQTDADAPVEIRLTLHNQGDLIAPDNGFWATLRGTFAEGAAALFASVKVIGIGAAFLAPWMLVIGFVAWASRRIYLARR
jgi:glycine cleavage system regulatory protein